MQKILYSQGYNLNQRHSHSVYNAAQRIFTSSGRHPPLQWPKVSLMIAFT